MCVVRGLHKLSPVAAAPLVVCNCSVTVETLFESDPFGHVKGAFTGAGVNKMGLFESAHGGASTKLATCRFPPKPSCCAVLQNQEVQRVGSLCARQVDVRVVAATNHELRARVAAGQFREDLYYCLSMVEIRTPALADRKKDLPIAASK